MPKILTINNPKITKGEWRGYISAIINFLPGDLSGHEMCACRTDLCFKDCFAKEGYFVKNFDSVWNARLWRSKLFFEDRERFMKQLYGEIAVAEAKLEPDQQLCIRPNGGSDVLWEEETTLIQDHPHLTFYDYSKWPLFKRKKRPKNYHLTYSYGGYNKRQCYQHLEAGYNVAVPHHNWKKLTGTTWKGYKAISGEEDDLRFLDPSPCWVLLKPKASLRTNKESAFAYGA